MTRKEIRKAALAISRMRMAALAERRRQAEARRKVEERRIDRALVDHPGKPAAAAD